jgi:hypothetical protein
MLRRDGAVVGASLVLPPRGFPTPLRGLIGVRTHSATAPMPPASSRRLTSDELAVIERVSGDIPAGPMQCADTPPSSSTGYPPPADSEMARRPP